MIKITDSNGQALYLPAVTEACVSGQWRGTRARVKSFDGTEIEASESAGQIAAAVEAQPPAQPVTWPRNAAEVREFMEDSCQREEYANDDNSPSVDDLYVLTAHDFLSAVNCWAESPYHLGEKYD